MKYYKLSNSLDIKELGHYPQDGGKIVKIGSLGGINGDYSLGAFGKINQIIEPPEPYISPKANLTSLLHVGAISNRFLTIHDELFEFLNNTKIPKFQNWKINVHHKNQRYDNYNLFLIYKTSQNNLIDFNSSDFSLKKITDSEYELKLEIINYENYLKMLSSLDEHSLIKCNRLVLTLNKNSYEMFRLGRSPLLNGYIISEKLKNKIHKEGFTGIRFTELQNIDSRIVIR